MIIQTNNKKLNFPSGKVQQSEKMERFLGVYIDQNLTFVHHVDHVVSKAQKIIYWLRVLKTNGVDARGLVQLYCCKIRSITTYAAPAWITFLSESQLKKLDRVEKHAMKAFFPEKNYIDALRAAKILSFREFCVKLVQETFYKIVNNPNHPLHSRLPERSKRPTRNTSQRFIHEKCRTTKRANSLFLGAFANMIATNHGSLRSRYQTREECKTFVMCKCVCLFFTHLVKRQHCTMFYHT